MVPSIKTAKLKQASNVEQTSQKLEETKKENIYSIYIPGTGSGLVAELSGKKHIETTLQWNMLICSESKTCHLSDLDSAPELFGRQEI